MELATVTATFTVAQRARSKSGFPAAGLNADQIVRDLQGALGNADRLIEVGSVDIVGVGKVQTQVGGTALKLEDDFRNAVADVVLQERDRAEDEERRAANADLQARFEKALREAYGPYTPVLPIDGRLVPAGSAGGFDHDDDEALDDYEY